MAQSLEPRAIQSILIHGTSHQYCGQRIAAFESGRRSCQGLIGVSVQLVRPRNHNSCHTFLSGPVDEEADRSIGIGKGFGNAQSLLLCLDILEVGVQLQASPKTASAHVLLKRVPQLLLQLVHLAQLFKAFLVDLLEVAVKHPEGLRAFGRSCAVNDAEGFIDAARIQQPAGDVGGDGLVG